MGNNDDTEHIYATIAISKKNIDSMVNVTSIWKFNGFVVFENATNCTVYIIFPTFSILLYYRAISGERANLQSAVDIYWIFR